MCRCTVAELVEDGVTEDVQPRRRPAPDVIALLVGLASLVTAVFAIIGYMPPLPSFDGRWAVAGAAVILGVILLGASLRRRDDT